MTFGWSADPETSYRIMDRAFEGGINFFDTADIYSSWIEGNKGGEWLLKSFPRRALTPIEALDAPLLLFASDLARHVTGAELTIDDGQSL